MLLRRTLIIACVVCLLLVVGGFLILPWYLASVEQSRRQQIANNMSQIGLALSNYHRAMDSLLEPRESFKASLEDDTTILTVTVANPNQAPIKIKDIVMQGLALGKVEPREKAELPIRVPDLAPGASFEFVLHYDHVAWISEDVSVDTLGTDWARQTLEYNGSWTKVEEKSDLPAGSDPKNQGLEAKGTFNASGVPVMLDPESARALKKRRDDGLKAKAEIKTAPPQVEPSPKP